MSSPLHRRLASSRNPLRSWALILCLLVIATVPAGCQLSPHMPDRNHAVYSAPPNSNSVAPNGWRRTKDGWEHTSNWAIEASGHANKSISELMQLQSKRESPWARTAMKTIRECPPHWIAVIQVLLIGVICSVSKKMQPKNGKPKQPSQ